MARYLTQEVLSDLVVTQSFVLCIMLVNVYVLRRSRRQAAPNCLLSVSVLVPARNEEAKIERCVRSLLAQ